MASNTECKVGVFLYEHGNEYRVANILEQKLTAEPIGGVLWHNAHPEARKRGLRYVGTGPNAHQIMHWYPGDPNGDPDQQAAHSNVAWRDSIRPKLLVSVHETFTPGGSYYVLGKETTPTTLISGVKLGYQQFMVSHGSFYRTFPEGGVAESSLADTEPETAALRLYNGIDGIASQIDSLDDSYSQALPEISFFQNFEIPTALNGSLRPGIEALEEIPTKPQFTGLELTKPLRAKLDIPNEIPLFYGYWGHINMSNHAPNRLGYTRDNLPRREWGFSVMVQIAPPIRENGRVIFKDETRRLSRKPEALLRLAE